MNSRTLVFIVLLLLAKFDVLHAEELVARVYGQSIYRSNINFTQTETDLLRKNKAENEFKEITKTSERLRLTKFVFDRAYADILGENSYAPSEQELQSFLKTIPETKAIQDIKARMTAEQIKAYEKSRHEMAYQFVRSWKINKRLYEKYGGRVVFQQAGLEPVDAYRSFINEIIKSRKIEIIAPEFRSILTPPFENAKQIYMNDKEIKKAFSNPWWEKKKE